MDATFSFAAARQAFGETFGRCGAPVVFIECRTPRKVAMERARRRDRAGRGASDATVSIVDRLHQRFECLDEVAPDAHVTLRTDRSSSDVVEDILAILDQRLRIVAS